MNKKVVIILIAIAAIVAVFAYLNAGDNEDRLLSQREARIFIKADGEEIAEVDFDTILGLEQHEFTEVLRSSDKPDQDNVYEGVRMKDLFEQYDISLGDIRQVVTKAADGYTVALSSEELLDDDNVYIVYKINGEPLAPKEKGGSGPYQVVIRKDQFGQRWNKFLMELDIKR